MDLGLHGQRVAILGSGTLAEQCAKLLREEGARVASDGLADCFAVIAIAPSTASDGLDAIDDAAAFAAWDHVTELAARFRAASEGMTARGSGRIVWIGPIDARQRGETNDGIDGIVGLGALGLMRAMAGELGPSGITCNSVLWDGRDVEAAAHAALFLASVPSGYVSGTAITVDGGMGEGLF